MKINPTILVLATEYSPNIVGGLGRHVSDIVAEGNRKGLKFIVVTTSSNENESYTFENGIHVYRLVPLQHHPRTFIDYILNVNFRFIQFVLYELKLSFDIIHVHDWLTGIAGVELKTEIGKPLLATIHSTEDGRMNSKTHFSNRIHSFESSLIEASDNTIVCSRYMENILIKEFNCTKDKLTLIPNGIIPKSYLPPNLNDRLPFSNSPYLLGMGRLVKEKGFQYLLKAFSIVHKQFPEFRLIIAGEGPFHKELVQLAYGLHIDKYVSFIGFVQEEKRNVLLHHCEMLVVPSLYEPFGIIALEGMVAAKPIVSFQIGGLAEILNDSRGILVNDTSSSSLADTICDYFSEPQKYNEIVQKGFYAANTIYNLSYLIEETILLYKKLVK